MTANMVLIVDDEKQNRDQLKQILNSRYKLAEADSTDKALGMMYRNVRQLAAVIVKLGAVHGKLDGYRVLTQWNQDKIISGIPMIAAVGQFDTQSMSRAMELGVWELLAMPLELQLTYFRVKNVIERRLLRVSDQARQSREYDELTGIYNRKAFLCRTKEMLCRYPQKTFAFVHLDIYQFHLVNQFYGMDEADRLLQYIADRLAFLSRESDHFTYGRDRADVFCFCMPYEGKASVMRMIKKVHDEINQYPINHVLMPVFGICTADHTEQQMVAVSDRANLAAKQCKGNYIKNYAFYDYSMTEQLIKEQKIVNAMKKALADEQFQLYIQPKYDLRKNRLDGGEVLVRWHMQGKGMVSPGDFIPVFERNGFITKLDRYVWEHACQSIRKWLDEGKKPFPISVNISRVSLYNKDVADVIHGLVKKYGIDPALLHLELTESAYTGNLEMIKQTMSRLQAYGFCILMDDFGSGYSSLNTLKDIVVDILKIDMNFLLNSEVPGRGENILASVVYMAKCLGMPVIAEGVERESQAAFLRSIGCDYVQGYYFAKPMSLEEYEQLAFGTNI